VKMALFKSARTKSLIYHRIRDTTLKTPAPNHLFTFRAYPNNPSSFVILRRSRRIWLTKSPNTSGFTSLRGACPRAKRRVQNDRREQIVIRIGSYLHLLRRPHSQRIIRLKKNICASSNRAPPLLLSQESVGVREG